MAMAFDQVIVFSNLLSVGIVVLGWIYVMTRDLGWLVKVTPLYHIQAGLFHLKFAPGVIGIVANFAWKAGKSTVDRFREKAEVEAIVAAKEKANYWTLQSFREYCCQFELYDTAVVKYPIGLTDLCFLWTVIQIFSMTLLVFVPIALGVFVAGGISDLYYHSIHARRRGRKLTSFLYGIAPAMLMFGLFLYMFGCQFLKRMTPMNSGYPYGWCCWFAGVLNIIAWIPWLLHRYATKHNLAELQNEQASAQKHLLRDYGDLLQFEASSAPASGAAAGASAPAPAPAAAFSGCAASSAARGPGQADTFGIGSPAGGGAGWHTQMPQQQPQQQPQLRMR